MFVDDGKLCLIYDHAIDETLKGAPFPVGEWSKSIFFCVSNNRKPCLFMYGNHVCVHSLSYQVCGSPLLISSVWCLGTLNTAGISVCWSIQTLGVRMKVSEFCGVSITKTVLI